MPSPGVADAVKRIEKGLVNKEKEDGRKNKQVN